MPLDPVLQMIVDNAASAEGRGSLAQGTVEDARAGYAMMAAVGGQGPDLAAVEDRTIAGPAGEIPIRVYTPVGDGPFPMVLFLHGGGFVIGSLETHDPLCRQLAGLVPAVVVSVDYRLAPEHRFPAAADDAWAALQWVGSKGAELGGDPSRLAVAGDSAGGNLAAVVAQMARDEGGPSVALQVLIYPTVDAHLSYPSIEENAAGPFLTKDTMQWFMNHYSAADAERDDLRMSPILATDFAGLPSALILTAEFDPLRDEGEAYGEKLKAAGVPTTVHRYDGMAHVFVQLAGVVPAGKAAIDEIAAALRGALS